MTAIIVNLGKDVTYDVVDTSSKFALGVNFEAGGQLVTSVICCQYLRESSKTLL